MNQWLAGFYPKVNAMCFWFGTRGLQHVMSILSCSLLVPSSKKVNPKMLNYCRDMMALSLFHVLLPPISANCSGFSHRLLLLQKDMHSMTKQHVFSFSSFFFFVHTLFSPFVTVLLSSPMHNCERSTSLVFNLILHIQQCTSCCANMTSTLQLCSRSTRAGRACREVFLKYW